MEIKAKINKWELVKLKSSCTMKKNYKQGEKTAFRMGEIVANEASDKELILKIYKLLMQLNTGK